MVRTGDQLLAEVAENDVGVLMWVLRRSGPVGLHELQCEPALQGWAPERLERAVAAAWARALIDVDRGDRLVAL